MGGRLKIYFFSTMDKECVFHDFLRWVFARFFENYLVKYPNKVITQFSIEYSIIVQGY